MWVRSGAASLRIAKAEFFKNTHRTRLVFQGHTGHTSENLNNGWTNSCVWSIVSVYINGRTVQDITCTGQPVNPIGFHYERFKAYSYLFWCSVKLCALSLSESLLINVERLLYSVNFYSYGRLLEKNGWIRNCLINVYITHTFKAQQFYKIDWAVLIALVASLDG